MNASVPYPAAIPLSAASIRDTTDTCLPNMCIYQCTHTQAKERPAGGRKAQGEKTGAQRDDNQDKNIDTDVPEPGWSIYRAAAQHQQRPQAFRPPVQRLATTPPNAGRTRPRGFRCPSNRAARRQQVPARGQHSLAAMVHLARSRAPRSRSSQNAYSFEVAVSWKRHGTAPRQLPRTRLRGPARGHRAAGSDRLAFVARGQSAKRSRINSI